MLAAKRIADRLALISAVRWLIVAAILHIVVTLVIFFIGRLGLLPNVFDEHGIGIAFAIDGLKYLEISVQMADELLTNGLSAWASTFTPFHCRLYSLTFAFLGPLVGHNILAAEPLNLVYYLGTLTFAYLLAKENFGSRAGFIAAAIIGVWPSFLLHSTQLIRDSLSSLLFLALLLILTRLVRLKFSRRRTVVLGFTSIVLIVVLWMIRGNWWNIVFVSQGIAFALLLIRMLRERNLLAGNLIVFAAILLTTLIVPGRIKVMTFGAPPTAVFAIPTKSQASSSHGMWTRFITQISARRGGFRGYTAQTSNIDAGVAFNNASDVVRFLPRAAVIGFFAPFPRMWFESGTMGPVGRVVSGLETFLMYLLYIPAAVCIWTERRKLTMWLIFLTATLGIIALGLVVVNAGALFRLRYIFWMLVIVMAAEGILRLRKILRQESQEL